MNLTAKQTTCDHYFIPYKGEMVCQDCGLYDYEVTDTSKVSEPSIGDWREDGRLLPRDNNTTTKDGQTVKGILGSLVDYVGGNSTAKEFTIKDAEGAIEKLIEERCAEKERLARIDEVKNIPNPAYIGIGGKRVEPFITYRQDRLAQLQAEVMGTQPKGEDD